MCDSSEEEQIYTSTQTYLRMKEMTKNLVSKHHLTSLKLDHMLCIKWCSLLSTANCRVPPISLKE